MFILVWPQRFLNPFPGIVQLSNFNKVQQCIASTYIALTHTWLIGSAIAWPGITAYLSVSKGFQSSQFIISNLNKHLLWSESLGFNAAGKRSNATWLSFSSFTQKILVFFIIREPPLLRLQTDHQPLVSCPWPTAGQAVGEWGMPCCSNIFSLWKRINFPGNVKQSSDLLLFQIITQEAPIFGSKLR